MTHVFLQMLQRMRSFFAKAPLDRDLDAEMASHLDLAIEENVRRGMTVEEARRAALVRFGGVQQAREQQREERGLPWLDVLMQDLRFSFRTLGHDRGFALIAVLILGLGIGANVAVFSVVNTILLRPLPFHDPERLIRILTRDTRGGESSMTYSADAVEEFQQRNHAFQSVSGYFAFNADDNVKLIGSGQPVPLSGMIVMGNFFQTLGVEPMLGRLFLPEECLKNARPVGLLSYAYWKHQFAGNPAVVGQAVNLDGTLTTIIGVLPENFDFGSVFAPGKKADLFTPVIMTTIREWGNTLALIGRLKPGVGVGLAQAEADMLFPELDSNVQRPNQKPGYTANLLVLKDYVSGKLRRSLIVLWCAVGLILLIVCVNLSNLLLARAAARSKEFAMRSALGAGRGRLVRQLLTESLVLSAAGSLLGLGIAFGVTSYLAHQGSIALPLLSSVRLDGSALAWTVLIAVVAAVLFGLAPALRMSRSDLQDALKDSGHGASAGRKHERMRAVLVISEVALACVLLVGAGLLLRSFMRVLDVDLGFEPSRSAAISVDYGNPDTAEKARASWKEIQGRVQSLPGIEAAGISDMLPMSRNRSWGISAKGHGEYAKGELEDTFVYIVSPGYLNAIGMRLVKGRDFDWNDGFNSEKAVIINETVAKKLWPGQDAVGRIAEVNGTDARVIGVVSDVHESSAETAAGWQMYLPLSYGPVGAELVVRTKLPPATLASSVMHALREINPGQPATEFIPIQTLVDHSTSPRRFFVMLVGIFAGLGLLLASLGIYGVISYSVTRQTQEIGIRMALGASRSRVQLDVIRRTLWLALAGIAVGAVAAFGVGRLIASLLFGTEPTDPLTFAGMVLLLGTVALLAGYIPARRASRIDPMIALRTN
ncbi:ABC transporter permease [Acidobacterium sp. S8]|uniref:ABC transporter permease n=1 Tax=Acidobacterium sp. S8 TaxID=1641854 RepID=UPI001C20B230|nr:ABC transporter permease [Acidobacterium sp. S8]